MRPDAVERTGMGDVVRIPVADDPIDLDQDDVRAILEYAKRLGGNWLVRFVRMCHAREKPEPKWGYFFFCGPADDGMPIITITRTASAYRVISWDILQLLMEGNFTELRGDTIAEALNGLQDMVASAGQGQSAAGCRPPRHS